MKAPKDYFFTETHEWVRFTEDNTALVGISDHAQEELGDIAFVGLCAEGDSFDAGDSLGDIESIKAVSEFYAPVGGTVLRVNDEIADAPEKINADPYGTWLVELENYAENPALMNSDEYEALLGE